jgi:hypothetical protein
MKKKQEEPTNDKKRLMVLLTVLFVLIIAGTVMAMVGSGGGDSRTSRDEVDRLRDSTREKWKDKNWNEMTEEERKERMQDGRQVWEKYQQLPFDEKRKDAQKRMDAELQRSNPYYAQQSEEERKAWLDKYIQDNQRNGGGGGGPGRGGPNGGQGGPNGGQGGANAGQQQQPTPQQAQRGDDMRREMLQTTTPEQRAQQADFRYQVKQQAQALGLPVPRMGPPGGFGGFGGPRGGGGPPGGGAAPPVMP